MRLIDADALIKRLDYCVSQGLGSKIAYMFGHMVDEAPTVDAVPMTWITDYEAKIVQNLVEIVQSKDFDDDEFHTQTCMLMAVAELQTAWAERKEEWQR